MLKQTVFWVILVLQVNSQNKQNTLDILVKTQEYIIKQISAIQYTELDRRSQIMVSKFQSYLKEAHVLAAEDPVRYVGNPINAYTLVMRMTRDLMGVEKILNNTGSFKRNDTLYYPSLQDAHYARGEILKLQHVYMMDIEQLASGTLVSYHNKNKRKFVEYGTPMIGPDCYALAYAKKNQWTTIKWYLEAYKRYDADEVFFHISKIQLIDAIAREYEALGDYKNAIHWLKKHIRRSPDKLGYYLLKHAEERQRQNETVEHNNTISQYMEFWKRCRGEVEYVFKNASLTCHYAHGPHPFLMLAPVKAEVLHRDPDIIMYYDVISDEKCEDLIKIAKPKLKFFDDLSGWNKTATSDFISTKLGTADADDTSPEILVLSRIAHMLTGLIVSSKLGGFGSSRVYASDYAILKYGIASVITPHFDILECELLYPEKRHTTILFYLSETEQGGALLFYHIGLTIYPVKNAALIWVNVDQWGKPRYDVDHAACPVLRGSKWLARQWIHGKGQLLNCPTQPPKPNVYEKILCDRLPA